MPPVEFINSIAAKKQHTDYHLRQCSQWDHSTVI